jgi:flagellar basal body-associated protein FliL
MPELSTPAPAAEAVPKAKSGKKVLVALLALALLGGGIFVWMRMSSAAPSDGQAAESPMALDPFVVNLAGEGRAYLRVSITLGLAHALKKGEEMPVAPVRDTIVSVLSAARPEQLLAAEGKQQMKTALLDALRQRVPRLGVESVYFTEFLVQM